MSYPHSVHQVEMLNVLGKCMRNDKGNVRAAAPLVFAQLGQPAIAPGLCTLGLPKDNNGGLADSAVNLLNDVGAELGLGHRLNQISRKAPPQQLLQLELEDLALGLLRPLLSLAFQLLDRAGHRFNSLILLSDA